MKRISTLVFVVAAALSLLASAQTQSIPTPASSVDRGGRAVVAITMPDTSNLATKTDISNVANTANAAYWYGTTAYTQVTSQSTYDKSWTRYFLGQTRCSDGWNYTCASILGDGSIYLFWAGPYAGNGGIAVLPTPAGQAPASLLFSPGAAGCSSVSVLASAVASPVNSNQGRLAGAQPYDWAYKTTPGVVEADSCGI